MNGAEDDQRHDDERQREIASHPPQQRRGSLLCAGRPRQPPATKSQSRQPGNPRRERDGGDELAADERSEHQHDQVGAINAAAISNQIALDAS